MFRGKVEPFAIFLVAVVVVVVVVGVGPCLAAPPLSHPITQEELILSVVVNQLAIMKAMNLSSSTSNGDELNQLREDMEKELQILNKTVVEGRNAMSDEIGEVNRTLQTGITALSETMNNEIQSMNERGEDRTRQINEVNNKIDEAQDNVQRWMAEVNEKLRDIQNTVTDHHQRPDPAGLFVNHNDSLNSICDGHKVLHGSTGALMLTSSRSANYTNNVDCSWTVTLPEGSRPVFQFRRFDIEDCNPCSKCDYVRIIDPNHSKIDNLCGQLMPQGGYFTIMNSKFKVSFHSNGSKTGKGFVLWYRAVEMKH